MKKYTIILAALFAFVACSKEVTVDEPSSDSTPANGEVHELFVALPSLSDVDTKASINVANGKFSWKAGDAIAVTTSSSVVYEFTAAADGADGEAVRFTYSGPMNGTPATITYPYRADGNSTALPTEIPSLTGALSAAYIRLHGTVTDNSATLEYENAFLKVTFTNVPTFARSIFFDGTADDVTISGISLAEKGDVVAYIPVSASNTGFTVSIRDKNSNIITAKATSSAKSFTNGTIKNMKPVPVGKVITINDDASKGWGELAIWQASNSSNNYRFKTVQSYPAKLNELDDGVYYAVINLHESGFAWAVDGVDLAVSYEESYGGSGCSTSKVFLDRDLVFSSTSGTKLKSSYRIYAKPTVDSVTSMNIYVYENWGSNTRISEAWPGEAMTASTVRSGYYYWDLDDSYSGYNNLAIIFINNTSENQAGDGSRLPDTSTVFDHDVTITFDHFWKESTTFDVS